MRLYDIMLGVAGLTAVVVAWFFLEGLFDGSVSTFNIALWLGLLVMLGVVLSGSITLQGKGRTGAATAVAAVIAVPALLFAAFFGLLILTVDRWN